jgi:hypothetical protein
MKGRGAGCSEGWNSPFIGVGGALGRQQWVVTGGVKALMPLMAGRGYVGVKPGEIKVGLLKC